MILHAKDDDGSLSFFCRDFTIIIKITIVVRAMSYVNVFSIDVTFTIIKVIQDNFFSPANTVEAKINAVLKFSKQKNYLNLNILNSFSFVLMRRS